MISEVNASKYTTDEQVGAKKKKEPFKFVFLFRGITEIILVVMNFA